MFDHTIFANETLATDFTGEGFLAGMEAHVPSQIRFVIELLRAHFTFVRLVSSMFGKMLLIKDLNWESFTTLATLEWFLPIVEALVMLFQVTQAIEHFVALTATVLAGGTGLRVAHRAGAIARHTDRSRWAFQTISGCGWCARPTKAFVEVFGGDAQLVQLVFDTAGLTMRSVI